MESYLLRNGLIVNGNRTKPFLGSILIEEGKISRITQENIDDADNIIDVGGNIIAPGFIDMHSHSDSRALPAKDAQSKLFQGVTTEIAGNCGMSTWPELMNADNIGEFLLKKASNISPINQGLLIGHNTLRGRIVGYDNRQATENELQEMCNFLDNALCNGFFGLSLGLIYSPGIFSNVDELIELAKVVKKNHGILSVHMRNEADEVFQAVDEMIYIAEATGVKLNISHLKLIGKNNWHRSKELLNNIEIAKVRGVNITCDQYPYTATSTGLSSLVPKWAHDGGSSKMVTRLKNREKSILEEILNKINSLGGSESVIIANTHGNMISEEGKSIKEISQYMELSPEETIRKILMNCKGRVAAIYHSLNIEDVINIMKNKDIAVASDGSSYSFDKNITTTNPHPRNFGTFPRFFQMVRENNIMSIEDAVYKTSKLPANILGIKDRGELSIGSVADITVFDYNKIIDNSTFIDSVKRPDGIEYVFINGVPEIFNNKQTHLYPGKFLTKSDD